LFARPVPAAYAPGFQRGCSLTTYVLAQLDSAAQFNEASRPDLAGKERQEAEFLARFLPPPLPQADIDRILKEIVTEEIPLIQNDPRKAIGKVFKAFYSRVDKASVDPDLVKRRAEAILAA